MAQRRVWCETLPLAELADRALMRTLARYRVDVLAAVRPDDLRLIPPLLSAAQIAGVRVGLWPMLDDREGRWLNAHNHARFDDFVEDTLRAAAPHAVAELALDLEPPIGLVSAWIAPRRDGAVPRGHLYQRLQWLRIAPVSGTEAIARLHVKPGKYFAEIQPADFG